MDENFREICKEKKEKETKTTKKIMKQIGAKSKDGTQTKESDGKVNEAERSILMHRCSSSSLGVPDLESFANPRITPVNKMDAKANKAIQGKTENKKKEIKVNAPHGMKTHFNVRHKVMENLRQELAKTSDPKRPPKSIFNQTEMEPSKQKSLTESKGRKGAAGGRGVKGGAVHTRKNPLAAEGVGVHNGKDPLAAGPSSRTLADVHVKHSNLESSGQDLPITMDRLREFTSKVKERGIARQGHHEGYSGRLTEGARQRPVEVYSFRLPQTDIGKSGPVTEPGKVGRSQQKGILKCTLKCEKRGHTLPPL